MSDLSRQLSEQTQQDVQQKESGASYTPNGDENNDINKAGSLVDSEKIPNPSPEEISPLREAIFVFCVVSTQLLTQGGTIQTIPISLVLGSDFGVPDYAGEQSWFSAGFALTVGTFILIFGRLGDIYGYKTMYEIAYGVVAVATLILGFTAYTDSLVFFDVMRGLQGVGFSIAYPNSIALISHYWAPGFKRTIYMCLFGALAPSGGIAAALFTSLLTVRAWWAWAFWINCCVAVGLAILAFYAIPAGIGNRSESIKEFDWQGSIAGVVGLVLFNFAWNQGANVGWEKVYVYVLLIVGTISLVIFCYIETKVPKPLIPPSALKGDAGFVLVCVGAGWSSFGIWLFYGIRMSLVLDGWNPVISSVHTIPCLVMGLVAAGVTAYLIPKTRVSLIMLVALLFFLIANILMGTRPIGQSYWAQKFVSYFVAPFGMDMSFPAATLVLAHALPRHQQGVAASLVATIVNYSISVGLGIAGTVERYLTQNQPDTFEVAEKGIRGAFDMGMGLAGLGVVSALLFVFKQFFIDRPQSSVKDEENLEKPSQES